jgi:hypothetical protein
LYPPLPPATRLRIRSSLWPPTTQSKSTTFLNLTCMSVVHRLRRLMRNETSANLLTRPLRVAEANLLRLFKKLWVPSTRHPERSRRICVS